MNQFWKQDSHIRYYMVYTKLLLLYSLIGVGGNGMWFSPMFCPNLCMHELGSNWVPL